MRSSPPRLVWPFVPEVTVYDETDDGFAECTVEVNGRLVACCVLGPHDPDDMTSFLGWARAEILRRC